MMPRFPFPRTLHVKLKELSRKKGGKDAAPKFLSLPQCDGQIFQTTPVPGI
jgi:hypothetical protein